MTLAREISVNRAALLPRRLARLGLLLAAVGALAGCSFLEGSRPYYGPASVIAKPQDSGTDEGGLVEGDAAIAYDPDGCQVWIIDDGLEGYSSPRFDPKTGLPVCDGKYPPGTVIGDYQSESSPIKDWVPR
jgi:hypothetical protein